MQGKQQHMPLAAGIVGVVGTTSVLSQSGLNSELKELALKILPNIPRHDAKMSYEYPPQNVDFHYTVEKRVIYLVANYRDDPDKMERRIPFLYLDKVMTQFKDFVGCGTSFPDVDNLTETQCRGFDKNITECLSFCNDRDKIKLIQKDLDEVKEQVFKNIETVMARGDNLEKLMDKVDDLTDEVCSLNIKQLCIILSLHPKQNSHEPSKEDLENYTARSDGVT